MLKLNSSAIGYNLKKGTYIGSINKSREVKG
jgi:hypothetical protein